MHDPDDKPKDSRRRVQSVRLPLAAGALLRITLMLAAWLRTGTSIMTQGDSKSYLEPARNLLLHGIYASHSQTELDRTPGYPLFTALTGAASGHILLTILVQIVLASITLLLIRRIANLTFPHPKAGIIAAWLFALDPGSIVSSIRIMPEALFVLLLVTMIERFLTFHRNVSLKPLAAAGCLLAVATYVRPVSYYLVLPLTVALIVTYFRRKTLRWQAPAILLLCTFPWLAAWQLRNKEETGYNGFSSIVEKNLYYFQSAEVTAELSGTSLGMEQGRLGYSSEAIYLTIHPEQLHWTQAQRLQFMRSASVSILSQHRALYLRTHFYGVSLVAFTPAATEFLQLLNLYPSPQSMPRHILNEGILHSAVSTLRDHPALTLCMTIFEIWLLFLYVFAIRGVLSSHASRFAIVALVGIALYFLLISGGAQAVGRYRLPVLPELCVLAGGGLATAFQKKRVRSEAPLPSLTSI
jgi:hypothetical protein